MAKDGQSSGDGEDDRPIELPIGRKPAKVAIAPPPTPPVQPRDPRFDPRCSGSSEQRHFAKNYAFLDEIRHQEIGELQRALRKEKDDERRQQIKLAINRTKNKMVERENKSKRLQVVDELRKESSPSKSRSHGRKFVNKSDIKKRLIVNKYFELKKSGRLSRYLERKRKKLINRDSKAFDM